MEIFVLRTFCQKRDKAGITARLCRMTGSDQEGEVYVPCRAKSQFWSVRGSAVVGDGVLKKHSPSVRKPS